MNNEKQRVRFLLAHPVYTPPVFDSLPAETTDFSGLDKCNNSVSNMFLMKFCQVNFEWISPCDTETYIVRFLMSLRA